MCRLNFILWVYTECCQGIWWFLCSVHMQPKSKRTTVRDWKKKYTRHQYISTNLINPPGHFKGWRISTVWGALCSLKDAKHCTINKEIHHFTTDMLFQKKRYAIISDVMCSHGRGPGECSRYSNSLWNGRLDDGVARDFLFSTTVKTVPVTQRVSYSTGIGALSRG